MVTTLFDDTSELVVELVAGAGGLDSRVFVQELLSMYARYAIRSGLEAEVLSTEESHAVLGVRGGLCWQYFQHEPGQHVIQRVPATERRDRRQTSLVSVLVLPLPPEAQQVALPESELRVIFQPKGGPGGQHRNRTASACRMTHLPTGLSVFIDGREQHQNRREAYRILCARVSQQRNLSVQDGYDQLRRQQYRGGGRGGKVRTYNVLRSQVVDHRLGTRTTDVHGVLAGRLELILPSASR